MPPKNRGKIGENKRNVELAANKSSMSSEKKIYGTIYKVYTDEDGVWSKPLVKVRYEVAKGEKTVSGSSGIIGGEDTWLELADDPTDIALRFGEPQTGDRVVVVYYSSPWLGKVYMVRGDNAESYGASEIGQDAFLIFTPGE